LIRVQVAQVLEQLTAVLVIHVQHHEVLDKLYDQLFSRLSQCLQPSVSLSQEASQIVQQLSPLLYPWLSAAEESIAAQCAYHVRRVYLRSRDPWALLQWLFATAHAASWQEVDELAAMQHLEASMRKALQGLTSLAPASTRVDLMAVREMCAQACTSTGVELLVTTLFHRQRLLGCLLHGCDDDLAVLQSGMPCNLLIRVTAEQAHTEGQVIRFALVSSLNHYAGAC
jgi:uncharacterized protein with von Willebrand factor type A (vWA) domain